MSDYMRTAIYLPRNNIFAFVLSMALLLKGLSSAWAEEFDLRSVRWGMSQDEVRASESLSPKEAHKDGLVYFTKLGDMDTVLAYLFRDDRLVAVAYTMLTNYSADYSACVRDFELVKGKLSSKYGTPGAEDDRKVWKDRSAESDPSLWPAAVATGNLSLYAQFLSERTLVRQSLKSENGIVVMTIGYADRSRKSDSEMQEDWRNLVGSK